jgi:hypothetical protein
MENRTRWVTDLEIEGKTTLGKKLIKGNTMKHTEVLEMGVNKTTSDSADRLRNFFWKNRMTQLDASGFAGILRR